MLDKMFNFKESRPTALLQAMLALPMVGLMPVIGMGYVLYKTCEGVGSVIGAMEDPNFEANVQRTFEERWGRTHQK